MWEVADGVVVNPAAWTHYSYAIRDAVELLKVPVVEVHLSNVEEREDWRRVSVISDLVAKRVIGKGPDGYREALEYPARRPLDEGIGSTACRLRSRSRCSSRARSTSAISAGSTARTPRC